MPLLPLYGHSALRRRLHDAVTNGTLPASLLLQGPRGIGKQQLALWLGRLLLCESSNDETRPCGQCKACKMSALAQHPDLQWFFPRPRLKDADPDASDIREDLAEGISERLENHGLYDAPPGDQSIFVATIRALVQSAGMSPALARRKVFVVGDADRMVAQEGADQAANAFLKLLEEPPTDTTIILTSSEPGALLPTIRSRVVSVRVASLSADDMQAFLADPSVANTLDTGGAAGAELARLAGGAPGRLVGREAWQASIAQANRILDAATAPDRGARMRTALAQGAAGARGKFSDMLDALTVLLHQRARTAATKGDDRAALGAARAIDIVEHAKELAYGNVNPQLVAASLLRQIAPLVQ